ncbi:GNAT family N-acetyltransferase [Hyphobacterium indicum]|uniref:GNAT family N-acetyltransferase n=1 Tax=Hyphobacterium indicum TaxID=2162714 RepID=UPI000D64923D|nr:GNAT family N-acetyltransferase [Hyphobacterium indicum]
MILRPAVPGDAALLARWDEKPHVKWCTGLDPDQPLPDVEREDWAGQIARDVDWLDILIGEVEGRAIGVVQIIDPHLEESHYWGDCAPHQRAIDIWIGEESDLGKGHGTKMMQQAIDRCFADPAVTTILIDPLIINTAAIRFYRRLGFVDVGERRFGEDDCLVMELPRAVWQF